MFILDVFLKFLVPLPRHVASACLYDRITEFRLSVSEANIVARKQPTQLATRDKNGFAS